MPTLYNIPHQINKTVTTAATRVAIASSETPFKIAIIQAVAANGGIIYIGDSAVSSTVYGIALSPGGLTTIGLGSSDNNARYDFSTIYLDTSNSGDKVSILYF